MTKWESIIAELKPSMEPAEHRRLHGSTLTVAGDVATVTAATEDAGRWLWAHYTHVLKMRIRAHGLTVDSVKIEF